MKKDAPSYLVNKFNFVSENNPYTLRNATNGNLKVPKVKTELYKKSVSYSGPILWNNLPQSICNTPSLNTFKVKIKNYLLNHANLTKND